MLVEVGRDFFRRSDGYRLTRSQISNELSIIYDLSAEGRRRQISRLAMHFNAGEKILNDTHNVGNVWGISPDVNGKLLPCAQKTFEIMLGMDPHWRELVREALKNKGLSMRAASREAGRNETFVRDILKNNQTPSIQNFSSLARILDLDPSIVQGLTNPDGNTTNTNSGLIDRDLFRQIIIKIDEKRRIDRVRVVSDDPNEFAEFVADLYDMAVRKGGGFQSIAHHFGHTPERDGD